MTYPRLRAKSGDGSHSSEFLPQHLADAHAAAERILDATGHEQLNALGLMPDLLATRFRRIVLLAAATHDLGKANDHFQGMIWGQRDVRQNPQGLRHEWVTVLILEQLRQWLIPALGADELDFAILQWAIAGHHPSPLRPKPPSSCPAGAGTALKVLLAADDFATGLAFIADKFGCATPPALSDVSHPLVGSTNVFDDFIARWERSARKTWQRIRTSPDGRLVAAVKNCLIAADVAGSALPKAKPNDPDRWRWISDSFADKPQRGDLQAVVDIRLSGSSPRRFQVAVADSTADVVLVKAGCGSGKTLSAYMRAAKNHPTRRLYFCYPTTGTATEGFKDYLFDELESTPRIGADLFHGRAEIDFEVILNTGPDATSPMDEAARLDSLVAWKTPVVACTVDTVLGIVQNNRRGLFAWPALAQSAFVFDEIHAYDDRLFGALLRFLQDLPRLPVLLMTASLPHKRDEALQAALDATGRTLDRIPGPPELQNLPRYYRESVEQNDPFPLVAAAIREGGKVLWVSNTVKRVMETARRSEPVGLQPFIYHSRFKYEDRVARHKAVVNAFDPKYTGPVLACTSQVAELSLDLKGCNLLVSDIAPVPSMIQRLGRLNRQARPGGRTMPFVVVELDTPLPYSENELNAARAWLAQLPLEQISQSLLMDLWEQEHDTPPLPATSAWLDDGPITTVKELRDTSPGITVLMKQDVPVVRRWALNLSRYLLPMPEPPRHLDWKSWPRMRGIPIAPDDVIRYDSLRGAEWAK